MAAPSPATFRSAPPPSSSGPPPSPAASASSPSEPPASAPSPSPVKADDTDSPAVPPNSNSLSIPPQPPPPPLLAPSPSITPAAAPPLPPPPTSILNSLKIAPRPVLSPHNPPSRPPSAPPTGDAPPPLLLPLPPPPAAVKAPKSSPQAKAKPPSSSSSPPSVVSANAGDAPTEIHNLSHPSPTAIALTRSNSSSRFSAGGIAGIGIGVGLFILLSFVCVVVWCKCRRRRKISGFGNSNIRISFSLQPDPPTSDASIIKIHSSAPLIGTSSSRTNSLYSPRFSPEEHLRFSGPRFTFEELGIATNWFSPENLLGKHALQENIGSFVTSHVYKGHLPNGREIAVKHHPVQAGAIRGFESEFKAELEIISRVHHRHLVSLVGYCITDDSKFLVYDYIPNNTLCFHLHGEGAAVLDWAKRVRIAVGAARGIAYLHEDCCPRIIHRDIKSSNILLDNNYEPWVSDFGLAKLAFDANPHIATRVTGTFGYIAPENELSGELTEKSDVYSFGVVLLELITGQKPIDISVSLRDEGLVEWARPLLSRAIETEEFDGLIDPSLHNNYIKNEMSRMIEAAVACLRDSAAERPRMGQVVKILSNVARLDLMNVTGLGESEVLNADERSHEIEAFRRMQLRSHGYSTEYFSL